MNRQPRSLIILPAAEAFDPLSELLDAGVEVVDAQCIELAGQRWLILTAQPCVDPAHLRARFGPEIGIESLSAEVETPCCLPPEEPFVLTLLTETLSAQQLAKLYQTLLQHRFQVQRSRTLTTRGSACTCCEFVMAGAPENLNRLHAALLELSHRSAMDLAIRAASHDYRHFRLAVFDMDSTLIEAEVIDELAKEMGIGEQVAKITAAAMRGELDFQQSFRQRVSLLQGLREQRLLAVTERILLMNGAERLFRILKKLGVKTAVCSGGFTFMAERLQHRLGIDIVYANELEIQQGVVTGAVPFPVVDGNRKAELVRQLAAREGIHLDQVIAVGDGANDLPMINLAGMGVAFRAKPVVRASAKYSLSHGGLDALLYLLGLPEDEIRTLELS
jgi:phosphoserine phosphatase